MNDIPPQWFIVMYFITLYILVITAMYTVQFKNDIKILKSQAVENNHAQYNSKTAEFEWIKNN